MGEATLVLFRDGVFAGRWQKDAAPKLLRPLVMDYHGRSAGCCNRH